MTAFPFRSCWAPHLPHLALGSVFSFALSATSIQIRYPSNFAIPVSQMSSVMQQGNRAGATMTPALGRRHDRSTRFQLHHRGPLALGRDPYFHG